MKNLAGTSPVTQIDALQDKQAHRIRLLAQVHLSRKYSEYYAIYEADYRAMLERYFNVSHVADLTIDELEALAAFLNDGTLVPVVPGTAAQLAYLRDCWRRKTQQPEEPGIRQWCYKLFGIIPLRLESLSKQQLNCLINAINRI